MNLEQPSSPQDPAQQALEPADPPKTARRRGSRHPYRGRTSARIGLALLFLLAFSGSVLPWGRAAARSALLLPALVSASDPAALNTAGGPVRFTRTTITSPIGPVFLDIYQPDAAAPPIPGGREGLINIIGVGDNRADPQLINLSRSLAQAGIVVVNLGTPTLFDFQIQRSDTAAIAATYTAMTHWSGIDPQRIGVIGFSAGGPLACFAAAEPELRGKLAFVTSFGGFFDTTSLLRDFGRRAISVNGRLQPWQPLYVPLQVFANTLSSTLSSNDSALLQITFQQNGRALTSAEQEQLSAGARGIYHLLAGDQPTRVEQNMAALTPPMLALLHDLSPSTVLNEIQTPIYLLHDRTDQYLPFTQSRDFAAALDHTGLTHDYAEFGIFQHVEVRSDLGIGQLVGDGTQLFRILSKITLPGI